MREVLIFAMEAHNDERNHHRRYEVRVGTDLLNHWIVVIRYGRVGQPLHEIQFAEPDIATAKRVVQERLRRRLSAPRRIGCAYRLVNSPVTYDAEWQAWLRLLSERAVDSDQRRRVFGAR